MTAASDSALLHVWLSPAFPVGSYAYSHGLEAAVDAGDIRDAATLRGWIDDLVAQGGPRNDAILLAEAWRAAVAGDDDRLVAANALALALAPSRERLLEIRAQGDAFIAAIGDAWACAPVSRLAARARDGAAYPVALAAAAAGHQVSLEPTLLAFLIAFVANLVSAATRLGVIGQTDAQRILAATLPALRETACACATMSPDDLGGFALRSDVAAMRHETQYSRLFRT